MKSAIKKALIVVLPLAVRKRLAIWINRSRWLDPSDRGYWATELLADFAANDANEYHRFLWRYHLAYADTYEVELRFGYDNLNETRRVLFADLPARLVDLAGLPADRVTSVLEVGCSLGYLLRYIETDVFPRATRLEGVDIDAHAIERGRAHLATLGSRVKLHQGDMVDLDRLFGGDRFDLVLGSGVLLYLDESQAAAFVALMLAYTRGLLVITALAHPERDNCELMESVPRARDGTWIHNVDRMIEAAGGRIAARRWEGGKLVDGNTIYFLYALPRAEGPL